MRMGLSPQGCGRAIVSGGDSREEEIRRQRPGDAVCPAATYRHLVLASAPLMTFISNHVMCSGLSASPKNSHVKPNPKVIV